MTPEIDVLDSTLVARLQGELDMQVTDALRSALDQALNASGAKNMLFDLRLVSFIDSSGLGVILGRYRRIADKGGRLAFVNVEPPVRRVLELSGVLRISTEFQDEQQAIADLAQGGLA
ncbi:MAG: STAS domain-containing protein [Desulforudis sp.]|jgi:stage II sporulation protein AA (anti-sigma F factor antagonist)|nr:anti-sigma factor antagonist [Clostridia bacterium]MDQ7791732.1 anti-sigma factor antagonist [Clostridia bacterium]RJX22893.1 MAG: STAS domain-containing protein [Desulforudis sp.]